MAFLEDKLAALQDEVVAEYFAMLREAEIHRPQETAAAMRIQSAWRGFFLRRSLGRLAATCTRIQRFYRGHVGRKYAAACRRKRDHDLRMAYFNAAATEIQRHFRGFYSRRYKHSYYARAAYIAAVLHNTERLRAQLQESYEEQAAELAEAEQQRAGEAYRAVLRQSHHLVSTRSCPGVFQTARHSGKLRTLNGLSVEEHLWETVHQTLSASRTRPTQYGSDLGTGRLSATRSARSTRKGGLDSNESLQSETLTNSRNIAPRQTLSLTPDQANASVSSHVSSQQALRVTPLDLAPLTRKENFLPRATSRGGASISDLIQRAADYETTFRAGTPETQRSGYLTGRSTSHAHTPGGRLSVQASSPYVTLEDVNRLERQKSARLAVSPRPFLTAVGADRLNTGNINGAGISEGTRYGIDEEQKKLEKQMSERLMRQISTEPFKVAARARQLFEDAAERVIVL